MFDYAIERLEKCDGKDFSGSFRHSSNDTPAMNLRQFLEATLRGIFG